MTIKDTKQASNALCDKAQVGLKHNPGKKKKEWDNPHGQERKQQNYYTKHNLNLIQIKNGESDKEHYGWTDDKELYGDRAIRNDLGISTHKE